jgi:branched-subunit amino acid ABC-type transport system permease component
LFTITLLNGPSHGLLLFMLSSGLTLIFSRMGVLNSRTRRSTGSVRNSRTR